MHAAAATLSDLALQPAPPQVQTGGGKCRFNIAAVITVVLRMLRHGRRLARTLPQRTAEPGFAAAARSFGTSDPDIIMTCVRRGVLRVTALYRMLARRAARGLEVKMRLPRLASKREQRAEAKPAARPHQWWKNRDLSYLPTEQEVADEVRRRAMGRILGDVCLDFGMSLDDPEMLWHQVHDPIVFCGGDPNALRWEMLRRLGMLPAAFAVPRPKRQRRGAAAQSQPGDAPDLPAQPAEAASATAASAECSRPEAAPCAETDQVSTEMPKAAAPTMPGAATPPDVPEIAPTGPP